MVSAVVVVARLSIVEYKASQVGLHQHLHAARTAPHNPYAVAFQDVLGTLAHIAGQHNLHAHLGQHTRDATLATATLWRRECLGGNNFSLLDGENGVVVTVAKVVIHTALSCRNCNLHIIFFSLTSNVQRLTSFF